MVTTNKKSTIDKHIKKEKEIQHNAEDSHQIPVEEKKGRKKGGRGGR